MDRATRESLRADVVGYRNTLLTLLAGVALASPAAAQWVPQSPVPTYLDVRGVGAPTANRVFLCTSDNSFDDGGSLWESPDGGATWIQRDVPFSLSAPLNSMFFLDDLHGWTVGNANYRTTDGGDTWTELPVLGSAYFVEFYTPTFGVTGGNFSRYFTTDAGDTWNPSPNGEFRFDFADASLGLGVSATGLSRTTDGGTTITPVLAGDADAVAFLSASVALAIVDGTFQRSTDGGATWTAGAGADGRSELLAVTPSIVLAWGRAGTFPNYDDRILRSDDGGQTWTDLGEPMPQGVWALVSPDASTVVGADNAGGMHYSGDAGQTWQSTFVSPGPFPGFLSSAVPAFADASHGYFGYGAGFAIRTTDGGATWSQISSGTGSTINDMDAFPNGDLIAVGENGTVMTSAQGLGPWILAPRFTTSHLTAVQVLGPADVMLVETDGRVHHSSDAGATWTAAASVPTSFEAADLHFEDPLDGWVVGFGFGPGALYHTTDGGGTWTPETGFAGAYTALDFEGDNGWAANVGGLVYRSTDAGASWSSVLLPGNFISLEDLDFWDVSTGYAVGRFGWAVRSDDAGATWQILPTPNDTDMFTDIYLLGPNELWLSTADDRAYYSANGGQGWAVLDVNSGGFGSFSSIVANAAGDAWTGGFLGFLEYFQGPPPAPLNRPPDASFDFVTTGMTVDLTDTSSDPDGVVVSWLWDFGDGATSTEQNPTHTFADPNTYIVRLTVTDDDGDTGSTVRFIVAQPGPGGTFGDFTEVTPLDPLFVTPQDEDFWVSTTAPADYDGDGDLDVAVLGFYVWYNVDFEFRLVLFRNDGPAGADEWEFSYVDVPLGSLSVGLSDLAWGDVDADGDQDLVVGSDGQTVIYRNDAGTLVLTDTVLPGYLEDNDQADFDLNSISLADYDNDGDQDLLLPSVWDDTLFEYRTELLRNDGPNGTGGWIFTAVNAGLASTRHAQSEWADFDHDEDLDLLLVHVAPLTDESFVRRYRNDGNGVFVGEDVLGDVTIEHGEAHWGDYDADGDHDILVAGHIRENGSFTQVLRVYRNDAGVFVPVDVITSPASEGWIDLTAATWADYDSDGDVDILLTGSYNSGSQIDGRARIYANDGSGNYSISGTDLPAPRASGSRGGTFSWLDIDGEGDLDYFIAGEYFVPGGNGLIEAQMHVYRNDVPAANAAPTAPGNLNAIVLDSGAGTVRLKWQAATDDHTPAAALTYDLELYRNGGPVAAPHPLPEPGNVSAALTWELSGLAAGEYTWVLRAVDSAYHAGPAAQGTFALGAVDVSPNPARPRDFALDQNFPNPFHPKTTFRFALPQAADVELAVYDLGGRLVTRVLRERREAGLYEVPWTAEGIASGTYFVRMKAGSFEQTRRVVILR